MTKRLFMGNQKFIMTMMTIYSQKKQNLFIQSILKFDALVYLFLLIQILFFLVFVFINQFHLNDLVIKKVINKKYIFGLIMHFFPIDLFILKNFNIVTWK